MFSSPEELAKLLCDEKMWPPPILLNVVPTRSVLSSVSVSLDEKDGIFYFANWRCPNKMDLTKWLVGANNRSIIIFDEKGKCIKEPESVEMKLLTNLDNACHATILLGGRRALLEKFPLLDPHQFGSALRHDGPSSDFYKLVSPQPLLPNIGEVLHELLYLGDSTARAKSILDTYRIEAVVNCAANQGHPLKQLPPSVVEFNMELGDSDRISRELLRSGVEFIDACFRENKRVLVHCIAGVNRSVTFTMAYLMLSHRMSLMEAFRHVWMARPVLNPWMQNIDSLLEMDQELGFHSCSKIDIDALLQRERYAITKIMNR